MSIAVRVRMITAVLGLTCIVAVLLGLLASSRLGEAQRRTLVTATALRNHVEGDMMHDALRADVFAALHAATSRDRALSAAAKADLEEHSAWFDRVLGENRQLDLSPEARAALEAVDGPLKAYQQHAREIVELAAISYPRAARLLPSFLRDFEVLEESMELTSDRLEKTMQKQREAVEFWSTTWMIALLGCLVGGLAVTAWTNRTLGRRFVGPIVELTGALSRLSRGELTLELKDTDRPDEIGDLARGLSAYRDAVKAAKDAEEARRAADLQHREALAQREQQAAEERRIARHTIADQLENSVATAIGQVSSAAAELQQVAERMLSGAVTMRREVSAVSLATEEAATNLTIVGSAADELALSIEEISKRTEVNGRSAVSMAETVGLVSGDMGQLEAASSHIASVSAVIEDIASKTNHLSLNATIEAVRAGAEGKGFAVVAAEIRQLAAQATSAASDITKQIGDVLRTVSGAAGSAREVEQIVGQVELATTSITTAVEQQSRATEEISQSMQRTIASTLALRRSIEGVAEQAANTDQIAQSVAEASAALDQQSATLRQDVYALIGRIREAA